MKKTLTMALGITAILSSGCITSYCQDAYRDHEIFIHSQAYTATLAEVYAKLKPIFQKYYPAVTMTNAAANGLHFEYEVTNFDFSTPAQPGSGFKQEYPIQKGPKHGGILCNVGLEKGKYAGQRLITFTPVSGGEFAGGVIVDRQEFKELLLVPYSTKRDAYLWVVLSYPPDASDEFLKKFREIVTNFTGDAN
jgi:hypothetical protein